MPSGYRRLKCLKFNGAPYIDTGFVPDDKTGVEIDFDITQDVSETRSVIWASNSINKFGILSYKYAAYNQLFFTADTLSATAHNLTHWTTPINFNIKYNPVSKKFTINNEEQNEEIGYQNNGDNSHLYIGARKGSTYPIAQDFGYMTLNKVIITQNNSIAMHLIPYLRLSDNKPGMYDVVNDVFYTNAGTGEFEWEEIDFKGLKFTNAQSTPSTVAFHNNGTNAPDVKFSYDGEEWTEWNPDTPVTLADEGDFIFVKGDNASGFSTSSTNFTNFVLTGKIATSGSIMSLIDNSDGSLTIIPSNHCFRELFKNNHSLISVPDINVSNMTVACFVRTFADCANLEYAKIKLNTYNSYCYNSLFIECDKLKLLEIDTKQWYKEGQEESSFSAWLRNAGTQATEPTIIVPYGLDTSVRDYNHIPEGWKIIRKLNAADYDKCEVYVNGAWKEQGQIQDTQGNVLWKKAGWTPPSTTPEAYATLINGNTLEFRYDGFRQSFDTTYNLNTYFNMPAWRSVQDNITTVNFHSSFANYFPTTFAYWLCCKNLTQINNIENLNTSGSNNMHCMFSSCENLTSLDLTNFDMTNVMYAEYMFQGCKKLAHIYCNEDWNETSSITEADTEMFYNCIKLPHFSSSYIDKTYAYPDNGTTGYFTPTTEDK